MGNKKSTTNDPSQTFIISKNPVGRRRIDIEMVQNVLLIWLDKNIDDQNEDCRNTISQLHRVVNKVNTYIDSDHCIQFIQTIVNNKVCMIISGALGQHIVPQLHHMSQIDSIFIFCSNKTYHESWAKEWPKIKGVFTNIKYICEALKQASQDCEQNSTSISFVARGEGSNGNLNQLDPSFMYTQVFKETLFTIQFQKNHIQEFIDHCQEIFSNNHDELKNIKKLKQEYRTQTPIWWYTYECFLYPMLNGALRIMDVDIMIKMGFFIVDLHRHIEQLHSQQFGGHNKKIFTVYRGQGLSKENFEQMKKTQGGLLSFNNFLSTSKSQPVSMGFARRAARNPDLIGILFVMSINPDKSTTSFASITEVSYFKNKEEEVLFSMHTVFRIDNIQEMDEHNRLFRVNSTLTDDNDEELRAVTDRIREESRGTGWFRLGSLLLRMGHFEKSEEVYEIMLEQTSEESDKASIYHQIGSAKYTQGKYLEAIQYYEKSLETYRKILPSNHPDLGRFYNNIGNVYKNMGEYSKALEYYQKSLEISQKSLPPHHPDLGGFYNNIGAVYDEMREYSKALEYYQKSLEIRQKSLPPYHPDLGMSYNNMGLAYENMSDYSKARSFYERAVDIAKQSLPQNHPHRQQWKNNFEDVKNKM